MNIFHMAQIRERYLQLQREYRSGTQAGTIQFSKWYQRVEKFAFYWAHGGQGYIRDYDIDHVDMSHLRPSWSPVPIRSFEQLSQYAHKLNWIVYRGKHWKID